MSKWLFTFEVIPNTSDEMVHISCYANDIDEAILFLGWTAEEKAEFLKDYNEWYRGRGSTPDRDSLSGLLDYEIVRFLASKLRKVKKLEWEKCLNEWKTKTPFGIFFCNKIADNVHELTQYFIDNEIHLNANFNTLEEAQYKAQQIFEKQVISLMEE